MPAADDFIPLDGATNGTRKLKPGSAVTRNAPTSGNAASGEVVLGNDTRLTDSRTPASHTHAISDVTNLQTSLDGKAASSHTHAISDVTGLQTSLDGKAASSHTHAISDVTGLQADLDSKVASSALSAVATSGDYGDLSNKPTIPDAIFKTIAVSGQSDVVADSATDTLTLVAGSNVTITTNASTDEITISSSGGGGGGAPTDAEYLVAKSDGTLSAERVATNTSNIEWDFGTSGQAKADLSSGVIASLGKADSAMQPGDSIAELNIATARLAGRTTASTGAVEEITVGTGLSLSTKDLALSSGSIASLALADSAVQPGALTGSGLTIATARVAGRTTAGTGAVEELSAGTGIEFTAGSIALSSAVQSSLALADTATQPGDLATVATSGKYSDLSGTPTIPDAIFKTIKVSGQSDVVADSATDELTLVAGSNITITTNASTDSITISASGEGGGGAGSLNELSDVTLDSPASVDGLVYDGSTWANFPLGTIIGRNLTITDTPPGASDGSEGDIYLVVGEGAGLGISDITGLQAALDGKQALSTELTGLAGLSANGLVARTSAGNYASRTIAGTSNRLTVTNGDGVSGNPTLDISSSYVGQSTITTLGTITTGAWTGTAIAVANGGTGATDAGAARTNLGGTTVGQAFFTAGNPGAIRFPRTETDNSVTFLTAAELRSDLNVADGATAGADWNANVANKPTVIGQAEAEAGTATTERMWTAERVKQAIEALAPEGGGGGGFDPANKIVLWDFFTGGGMSGDSYGGVFATNGVAADTWSVTDPFRHPGGVDFNGSVNASATTGRNIVLGANGLIVLESKVNLKALSNSTNHYTFGMGLMHTGGAPGNHEPGGNNEGVYLRYSHGVNSGKWQARCYADSETAADTGITVVAQTWYKLRIEIDPDAAEVRFYINGSIVATISTNIPIWDGSDNFYYHSAFVGLQRHAGSVAEGTMAHYFYVEINIPAL